jgi:membrane protease YdiL (CAAX protease family)
MYIGSYIGDFVMTVISTVVGYDYSNMLGSMTDATPLWFTVMVICIVAPVGEEFIFRKLLIDRIRRFGDVTAILVSALLFGAIHMNFYQFFYAALLGALFAYVYLRSGKVWVTMLLHALFNLFGGVLPHLLMQKFDVDALLAATDEMEMMSLIFENLDGFLLFGLYELLYYSLAAVGLILLLVFRKRLFLVPTRDELPRTWRARPMFGNAGVIFALAFCAVLFLMVMINTAQPLI